MKSTVFILQNTRQKTAWAEQSFGVSLSNSPVSFGLQPGAVPRDLTLQFLYQMRLRCIRLQTVLPVVFKVCFKTNQEECGGVPGKDSTGLMANAFIR